MRHPTRLAALALALTAALTACSSSDTAGTDRQAHIIALAMSYPRQQSANGLARAALALWRGTPNQLAILEASDLHPTSAAQPGARVVIRIHVPRHLSTGFGDSDRPARDFCYRLDFLMPSSSPAGEPGRIACPPRAEAITLPPAPPVPHLPADAQTRLAAVLRTLPPHPSVAQVLAGLRAAFPTADVQISAEIVGGRVGVAASVRRPDDVDCAIALRSGDRVESIHPDPRTLLPGEVGCVADQAIHPVITH